MMVESGSASTCQRNGWAPNGDFPVKYDLRDDLSTLRVVAFLIEHFERVEPALADPMVALGWLSADAETGRYALTAAGRRRAVAR